MDDSWLESLGLRMRDKRHILSGQSLHSGIMNAAITKIRRLSYWCHGLQPIGSRTTTWERCYKKNKSGSIVQILNLHQFHWIAITGCVDRNFYDGSGSGAIIKIYDTYRKLGYRKKENEIKYPLVFVQDACELLDTENFVTFSVENVIQTNKKENSGILAIIYAFILSQNEEPFSYEVCEEKINESLICFLETGNFSSQTMNPSDICIRNKTYSNWKEILYCHCKRPDFGKRMIECDRCGQWFHEECEEYDNPLQIKVTPSGKEWTCRYCCGIHVLPNEILRKIFLELCVEDEVYHYRLSLVCTKWCRMLDINFRDMVHFTWLDREFHAGSWSPTKIKQYRVGFDIMKCQACDTRFKPREGYYRDPKNKSVCIYHGENTDPPLYCNDCGPLRRQGCLMTTLI